MKNIKTLEVTQVTYDNMVANGTIDENTLYYIVVFKDIMSLKDGNMLATSISGKLYI